MLSPGAPGVRLLIALLGCVLLPSATASACTPGPSIVTEQLTVGQADLPRGVTVRATNNHTIMLANRSPLALYVIGTLDPGDTASEQLPVALRAGTGPLHKLSSGQVFTWRPKIVDSEQPPVHGWSEDRFRRDGLPIDVRPDYIGADRGPLATVAQRAPTGANVPATTALPPPQPTELTLVYGDQLLVVPLTLSYVRSEGREPIACSARSWIAWMVVVGLVGAILVVVVSVGLYRWRRG